MREKINEEVSLVMYYSASKKKLILHKLHWDNKDYLLRETDYYHNYMEGRDKQHIFELTDIDETLHFRLRFDSSNLHWTLEAIHDGNAD